MPQYPRALYLSALRQYGDQTKWSRRSLASKRTRLIIRLLAIEETLQQRNMGILTPHVMTSLRLMADYKEAHKRSIFNYKGVARQLSCDIPFEELELTCGHPRPMGPVIAALQQGDKLYDSGESKRGFFCSPQCARPRRVIARLVYENVKIVPENRRVFVW